MEDVPTLQNSNCWRISTLWTDVCGCATSHNTPVHTLCHHSSALCEQLDPAHVRTSYCNAPLLTVFQNYSLWEPAKCQHHFSYWRLCFKLLFALAMLDVSISYSGISSMALHHGFISHPQSGCTSRTPYLCGNTDPKGFGTLSNSCIYALLWTVLIPFWHILYLKSSLL
jgi:hypothetical protein